MSGALSGIKVLDLSRVLAGPWAGQVLGDLGADVVKVERPGGGDETRAWGPPWLADEDGGAAASAYFLSANRNKRSVAVDFTQPEGRRIVQDLAATSDVVIENFKVGGLAAYGLDYATLKASNPGLIYCSITGFGQTGPYAKRAGYDFLIQAMGGLMSITGRPDGEPGGGPQKVGVALTDVLTGLYSVIGILAALHHRRETGEGQHIDLALLDVQVTSLANQASNFLIGGRPPGRMGNAHPNIVPYQDFSSADGWLVIAVGNDRQFAALCGVLGHPEWAADARFRTNADRVANRADLVARIDAVTATAPTAHWIARCEAVGVPCGPINDLGQVFDDPHVRARGLAMTLPHPRAGDVALVASPLRLGGTPVDYRLPPPGLGEHTRDVLRGRLAMSDGDIDRLAAGGVIGAGR